MSGLFITFEGIEGSGKSTQARLFTEYLEKRGKKVLLTREPGGTDVGDQIRDILLNPKNISILPRTELLLYAAARAQHVDGVIRPAIEKGYIVISDRYSDATTAYQGAARNLAQELLADVHEIATGNLKPSITFLLDLPAEKGLERAHKRNHAEGKEDRFENEKLEFHKKVREGYLEINRTEPQRVILIQADKPVEEIFRSITEAFESRTA